MVVDGIYADLIARCLKGHLVKTRNDNCYRTTCPSYTFHFYSPLVSLRKTAWKNALREWQWFMSGSNLLDDLDPRVHHWWRPWAADTGNGLRIKHNYSVQFRSAVGGEGRTVDQIAYLIDAIKNHPFGRRHVITTWNAADMTAPDCPITNCHNTVTQLFVQPDGILDMKTYQRSVDVVCGVPHNWIQQWAFLMWLAHRTGKKVGKLHWEGGDCHVYEAHKALAEKLLEQKDQVPGPPFPRLVYTPTSDDFLADDFTLSAPYNPVNCDKAEMIV